MLQAGQHINDFELIRPLGRGGMGEVYEAQQRDPPRRVALKVLAPWLAENEDAMHRFRREVEVLADLDHPSIVPIISTGKTADGVAYYAMKLIRGISLSQLLRIASEPKSSIEPVPTVSLDEASSDTPHGTAPGRPGVPHSTDLTPREAVDEYRSNRFTFVGRVGVAAARALAAAHRQGHVHRDIKPSNIMVDQHGQLYLVDFGLTRALDPAAGQSMLGTVRGTPWYMSPEQARAEQIDQRSDIYSLGVTLYELATAGVGPFTANREDSESVLAQVRAGTHLPLRLLAPEIPRELERIILRAIQLKPGRRYPTADDLAAELERIIPSSGLLVGSQSKPRSRSHSVPEVVRSVVWPWGVGALVLLLAILTTPLWWRRGPSGTDASNGTPRQTSTVDRRPDGDNSASQPAQTGANRTVSVEPAADAYPDMLRKPPPGTAMPLLKADQTPVWSRAALWGDGAFTGLPSELVLTSSDPAMPTLIALANSNLADDVRPWFEYAVELRPQSPTKAGANQIGLFWGFPESESTGKIQFFAAMIDARSHETTGRVTIGSCLIEPGATGKSGMFSWLRPLPQGKGIIALSRSSAPGGWHKLRVRAVDHQIVFSVDDEPPQEFTVPWLTQTDRWLKSASLDARGAMGIWVKNGTGSVRNASYLALP